MAEKLNTKSVEKLPAPKTGNRIFYDSEVKGFGCRVTSAGVKSFILNYRTRSGRERRYTIGPVSEWTVTAARNEAKDLKKQIERGGDPLGAIRSDREAPTVADMCERFREEHLPKKRPTTQRLYGDIIDQMILPKLRHLKVVEVTFADVDGVHRKITKAEHGKLPPTVEVITIRGRHLYFRYPSEHAVRNTTSRIAPGIDSRGQGGYVLAPPSIHPSGRAYAWSVDSANAFAAAPQWLLARINGLANGKPVVRPSPRLVKRLPHTHRLTSQQNNLIA